jgi:hypothetical protein
MNYSGARLRFPESDSLTLVRSWCTGQSGAPDHITLSSLLRFNLVPNLNLLLVCVEPYALVIHGF